MGELIHTNFGITSYSTTHFAGIISFNNETMHGLLA